MNAPGSSLFSPTPQQPTINMQINVPINKRELFAMYALNGLLADRPKACEMRQDFVNEAVLLADALIEALK